MNDISNLSDTIIPKSNQLNSEQLLSGPITITVTDIRRGTDDQPVVIHYEGDNGRPYLPCKTCRKVLIFAWGDDGREWIGRSMVLFNDPKVKFGGVQVGGIRISHLSDIERDIALSLTATKGKKDAYVIKKLEAKKQPVSTVLADIEAAETIDELNALRPAMKGVPGALDAAKAKAERIRALEAQALACEPEVEEDIPI
jgi:hypothetical protein